jgi:2-phospho-L-lactate guanylyltransferase
MRVAALLPVKPIKQAKSRLSPVMTDEARERWVRDEFMHTLDVLRQVSAIDHILVISADPEVWRIALAHQTEILKEPDVPGLNQSLQRGIAWCNEKQLDTIMILPIDLPLLKPYCLRSALAKMVDSPSVVIVPDRHTRGTNLLAFTPIDLIQPLYGEESFASHVQAAKDAGIEPVVYRCPDLSIDVDNPDDLALVTY